MTESDSRRRVNDALNYVVTDRVPRDIWGIPAIRAMRATDCAEVLNRFPVDFARAPSVLGMGSVTLGVGAPMKDVGPGTRTDMWGSVWSSLQCGSGGEVTSPAIADWDKLSGFSPPWEAITQSNDDAVTAFCRSSDLFRLGEVGPGPFERLQHLRGTERLFIDLAEQSADLVNLLRMVHEFNLAHLELWCRSDVDAITMGDDWGSQAALLISPDLWRGMFKPLYKDYTDLVHRAGKYMFFHSDGMIREIISDLIDIGVDALNAQLFCMDIEELGTAFGGRVTFWGEIDRQYILPFGTVDEVHKAVRRVRVALDHGEGGLIAQLAWGLNDPVENVVGAFEEWRGAMCA